MQNKTNIFESFIFFLYHKIIVHLSNNIKNCKTKRKFLYSFVIKIIVYLSINIENCKTNQIYLKVFLIEKIKIEN
jgi:hypothetical protein